MSERIENQAEQAKNKKIYIKFAIILIASFFIGFLASAGIGYLKHIAENAENAKSFGQTAMNIAVYAVPSLFIGMHLICGILAFAKYNICKKMFADWNNEDEDVIDEIECRLNLPLTLANICTVLNFAFFAGMCHISTSELIGKPTSLVLFALTVITFIAGYVWIVAITNLVVNLEKKSNPEKKGNIFDTNFGKDWEQSCDEAQRLMIYQASYAAYQAASSTCLILWLLSLFLEFFAGTGLIPALFICIIWLVMTVVYTVTAAKLEKGNMR